MPDAIEDQIADAVAAGISAETYSAPYSKIQAIAEDEPDYEGVALRDLRCSVICSDAATVPGTRGGDMLEYQVGVILARHVSSKADKRALRALRQEVTDVIRSDKFALPEGVLYFGYEIGDLYLQEQLTNQLILQSKIMAMYRVKRDKLPASP